MHGSGHALMIQEMLDKILSLSDAKIEVKTDPKKMRPVDVPIIEPDIDKLKSQTGWQPEISIETTLKETLDFWRKYRGE